MVLFTLLGGCAAPGERPPIAAVETARAEADFDAALADLRAGRWAAAAERLQALVASRPAASNAWLNLAIARERLGDEPGARTAYEAVLRLDAQDCRARVGLGLLERRAGNFDASARHYRACLAVHPSYGPALVDLGILQELYLQRLPEALETYRRYLADHDDTRVAAWYEDVNRRLAAHARN